MLAELVYKPLDDQKIKINVEKVVVILLLLDQKN